MPGKLSCGGLLRPAAVCGEMVQDAALPQDTLFR